jgi:predicted nucleotidyltransferase component of viral defense system
VFSDDYFFERVVLKGGNALAIALGISGRTSLDLDFSIEHDFEDLEEAERRLKTALERRFATSSVISGLALVLLPQERERAGGVDMSPTSN